MSLSIIYPKTEIIDLTYFQKVIATKIYKFSFFRLRLTAVNNTPSYLSTNKYFFYNFYRGLFYIIGLLLRYSIAILLKHLPTS